MWWWVDETLLDTVDVTKGLSPTGAVIVNTAKSPGRLGQAPALDGAGVHHRRPLDSEETLGQNFLTPQCSARRCR